MAAEPSDRAAPLDEQQPTRAYVPGMPVPAARRGEAAPAAEPVERRRLKLRHHVEGSVEPWSQRPGWQEIVPLDLAGPTPGETEGLLAAVEELRHMAELGELSAVIAHEIRNPLAGIAATAEVLRDSLAADDDHREGVEVILDEVARLDTLVRDLLDFARSHEPRLLEADIADDVDRVARAVADEAEAGGVAVEVEAPDVCTPVLVDSELIQHVFLNLASNAVQAMPHGGTLAIRTLEPDVGSQYVCVKFADTGVGIQADDASRVFDPFFTTRADGVGLGLAAARRLVEAQGGYITVESTPGSGACFTVYLRVASDAACADETRS